MLASLATTNWRERATVVVYILAGLAVLGGMLWLAWSGPRLNDSRDGVVCARWYRDAHSAADTARVDHLWPSGGQTRVRNGPMTLRCGALRAAGRVPV